MSLEQDIKRCKTPQEALVLIARTIDAMLDAPADPWTQPLEWGDEAPPPGDLGPAVTITTGDDWSEVDIRPVSVEKQAERIKFAEESLALENLQGVDKAEAEMAYAKGGPVWLHVYDRDYVMGLSIHTRMAMVADLIQEDKEAAHMLSADILKDPSPQELGEFLAIRPEIEEEARG